MRRITTLRCLCGAQLDEVDTDTGIAIACRDCGSAEAWPEHITDITDIIDLDRTES
ncbi:hypothetical protein IU459_32760 [Nocardia amamiensis]|uniref:Lysine biosynthesis protein LysW n=1 Tax=Nocardia amamiensis TaxID=404578 RepID=A0ABS0D0A6_9NOCA|nr:hypothetical protein [Nocardia amamiensis]MBF6302277.1 hypothetical protein [Nocardia amamiensis]